VLTGKQELRYLRGRIVQVAKMTGTRRTDINASRFVTASYSMSAEYAFFDRMLLMGWHCCIADRIIQAVLWLFPIK
jgi:hypothetical protein